MPKEPTKADVQPPGKDAPRDLKNENPEALATFAATARNHGDRPKDHPDHATDETAAIPADLKATQKAAAEVLKGGVAHDPGRAQAAVETVPDRTRATK